jgi:hypothetical protein
MSWLTEFTGSSKNYSQRIKVPMKKKWANELNRNFSEKESTDPSTPPAGTENLHFTLNGETRRAPGPPVARAQMAWEGADKVSLAVRGTSRDNPGPEQHSPLDRLTSTWGKKRN